jgi:hypothetical protein
LIPSRVKVFVLMDSRVISKKKTNDCEPRRKEDVLGHTIHLFDVNIRENLRCGSCNFRSESRRVEAAAR